MPHRRGASEWQQSSHEPLLRMSRLGAARNRHDEARWRRPGVPGRPQVWRRVTSAMRRCLALVCGDSVPHARDALARLGADGQRHAGGDGGHPVGVAQALRAGLRPLDAGGAHQRRDVPARGGAGEGPQLRSRWTSSSSRARSSGTGTACQCSLRRLRVRNRTSAATRSTSTSPSPARSASALRRSGICARARRPG